jgi:hypothetical protein
MCILYYWFVDLLGMVNGVTMTANGFAYFEIAGGSGFSA